MKIENCHPKIEDRIDLRLCPLVVIGSIMVMVAKIVMIAKMVEMVAKIVMVAKNVGDDCHSGGDSCQP